MRTTVAWSKAQGAWWQMMLAVVLMMGGAFGQTATDLGEGLRVETTAVAGQRAVKWWGKAGRTYFVQSSETLLPGSWQYMPVVEAGAEGVCTYNLQTNASKMFVRLVYTDEVVTGSAADADFDGDGLSNAQETAVGGPGTSPLAADSDEDGYLDGDEVAMGTHPKAHDSVSQPVLVFFHRTSGSAAWKTGFAPFAGASDTRYLTKKTETNLSQKVTVNGSSTNPPLSWTRVHDWSNSATVTETWSRGVNTLYKGDTYTGAFNEDGSYNFDWRDEVDLESTSTDASGGSYIKVHRLEVIEPGDFLAHSTGRSFVRRTGFPDDEFEWDERTSAMGNFPWPPFPDPVVTTTDTTVTTTWEQDMPYGDDTHVKGGGTTVETVVGLIPDAAVVSALAGDFELEEAWPENFDGSGDGTSTLSLMGISASATATQYYYKLEWPEGTPERVKQQGNYPRSYLIQENYRSDDLIVEKKEYKSIKLRPGQSCETQLLSAISFDATRSGLAWVGRDVLPVEIVSRDRAVTGKMPHLGTSVGGNKKFEIGFQAGSTLLGKYEIPPSGSPQGVKIYDDAESDETGIFGDSELNQANSPPNEIKNQQVVLTREGGDIRFYTVADNISTFKVHLYLDGSLIGTVDHQLKADSEFEKFIAAIEGFVAGDDPRGIGRLPTPVLAAAPTAPQPTSDQTNNMLAMLPATLAAAYPGPTEASAWTSGSIQIDAESFRSWIRTIKDELTVEQWTPFAAYVAGIGYNVNGATGPVLNGWNAGAPADGEIQLPGSIRNRGLVAKVLIYWLKKQMEMGVSTGKGVVFGLWDGVKSDWDGVVDILKMPVQLYEAFTSPFKAASELYNTFKVLKGLTLEDVKGIAKTMFDEFISNQEARLAWPEPAGASDALKSYMGGYLGGYIGEQVAIAFLTAGGGVAVKAGKYIRTIIEKVRQGVKIVGAMTLIEGRLPKMFTQAVAKITSDEDLLRRIRAVSSRVKSVPMQARFARSCVDDLAVSANTARSRLRSSLGGVVGDGLEGHHLISWEHRNHNLVQKAARGGFNINNGGHNGVMLDPAIHQGVRGHPSYNEAIGNLLDALEREAANLTDAEAADLLIRNAGLLRMTILNTGHPLTMNRPKAGEPETTLLAHQRQTRNPNKATFIFAYAMGQSAA